MNIQALSVMDIPSVVAIEQATSPSPWTANQFADALKSGYQAWVMRAPDSEVISGFCIMQAVLDEATLLLIAVAPQYQRQGVATRLLQFAIDALPDSAKSIFLEVRQSNLAAQALYSAEGFNEIGLRPRYYAATATTAKEDAVLMAKQLGW